MLVLEVKLSLFWDVSEHCQHYTVDGDKAELVSGLMYYKSCISDGDV